ncbi:MAG TPA: AsmA-like C-terminal domain-containing protein [Nitrospirota bacterium]|nr:AsmA-like C-terminal domain-containing protein [Nitrospirota bacterium]
MKRSKIILLSSSLLLGIFSAFLAALAFITPRVINQETFKSAIETTISRELGGSLTYERIDIVIFPRPGVILRKPAVTVPKTFSGTLDSLEISPSLLPLLVNRFEIARIKLERPDFVIELDRGTAYDQEGPKPFDQKPVQQTVENILAVAASRMPDIAIIVQHGNLVAGSDGRLVHFYRDINGRISFQADRPSAGTGRGSISPERQGFRMIGKASCTIENSELFPAPLRLSIERFEALPKSLTVTRARASSSGLSLTFSGKITGYLTSLRKAEIALDGSLGDQAIRWIRDATLLPPELTIHAPLDISRAKLLWKTGGTARLQGNASVRGGTVLSFDLSSGEGAFTIREFRIKDRESEALLTLHIDQQVLDISFKGNLTQTTLNKLFEHEQFHFGWIKGDFRTKLIFDQPARSTAEGTLTGEGLVIPFILRVPFTIDLLTLRADGKKLVLDPALINIKQSKIAVQGGIGAQGDGLMLDLDLSTDGMGWNALQQLLVPYTGESKGRHPVSVLGRIQLRAGSLETERYTFRDIDANVLLEQDMSTLTLKKATVCGISVPGMVTIAPGETTIDLKPSAQGTDLVSDLACLTSGTVRISGSYLLSGSVRARGPQDKLLETLGGTLVLAVEKGKVYHDLVIIRTVAYLNVSDLLRGSYDNIEKDGVPFDSFTARATVRNGIITFNEAVLKSPVINMVGRGSINLPGRTMDLTLLAAPFTTVDAVVKWIPLIGEILGGSLVSIPVRIKGPLNDPEVTTLPVSSIGEGLLGMMKRTLTLPFKIIEPIIPKGEKTPGDEKPE